MAGSFHDIMEDLIPVSAVAEQWGYGDERQVKQFLDELEVPYVVIRRVRHYRAANIRAALDKATTMPRPIATAEHKVGPVADYYDGVSEFHETGPPKHSLIRR